ncbi:MAG TPA: class I SAM-dependent methyltransferase [Anaerolineaceae bacterium]|nr:class I SAM-dependent methyltransferase [Anaerolineaceae bacterium]
MPHVTPGDMTKAAQRGEPSYVWRDGQKRRFEMLLNAAGERLKGRVLVDGSGVGTYFSRLIPLSGQVIGLDIELPRVEDCKEYSPLVINGASEYLPLPAESADLVWSHEVLEHVEDDHAAIREMVRVLRPGGRIVLFCPNRGYPFETHGIYWRGKYHFGNKLFVNYLPRAWRDKLAPHVEIYTRRDLAKLFTGLPVRFVSRRTVFGAYDNIIARSPALGRVLRFILQALEKTPLQRFGLSHFWVIEKV